LPSAQYDEHILGISKVKWMLVTLVFIHPENINHTKNRFLMLLEISLVSIDLISYKSTGRGENNNVQNSM